MSDDGGRTWARSPVPAYTLAVSMTGAGWAGGPVPALRRERPELQFDDAGRPTHLLTGMMLAGQGPHKKWQLSYSIATRIGKAR